MKSVLCQIDPTGYVKSLEEGKDPLPGWRAVRVTLPLGHAGIECCRALIRRAEAARTLTSEQLDALEDTDPKEAGEFRRALRLVQEVKHG